MIFPPLLSGWLLLVTSIIQQNWRKIRCLANRESLDFQAFPVFRNRHKNFEEGEKGNNKPSLQKRIFCRLNEP